MHYKLEGISAFFIFIEGVFVFSEFLWHFRNLHTYKKYFDFLITLINSIFMSAWIVPSESTGKKNATFTLFNNISVYIFYRERMLRYSTKVQYFFTKISQQPNKANNSWLILARKKERKTQNETITISKLKLQLKLKKTGQQHMNLISKIKGNGDSVPMEAILRWNCSITGATALIWERKA